MKKAPPTFQAFTLSINGRANQLITKAAVSEAFDPETTTAGAEPALIETTALWDTGASGSVISHFLVEQMNLAPIGKILMKHGGGASEHLRYAVNLFLPNKVAFRAAIVSEMKTLDPSEFGMIIGMDVIGIGDFSITNHNGSTCFSFRVPSQHRLDYVKEFESGMRSALGPNSPCPCGNGKKYKKCHGAKA